MQRDLTSPEKKSISLWNLSWLLTIPVLGILWVLFSPLSFVPVPWPDDSAFYFPAKDLFSWPPRWVMIPQAPFEPTYRIWNFNTMPLFPVLIGIFRGIGVDGSHALKLIPLGGWFLSIFLILRSFMRRSAPPYFLLAAAMVLTFDPVLRWSSVLIRPESLIGAMGVWILYGFRFGWPDFLNERRFFHPVSLFLLIGAFLHFNAIHLVPVVIALYWQEPKKIFKIGGLTAAGLTPWLLTIALKPALFWQQMQLQFGRLTGFENPWLNNIDEFMKAMLPDMGNPESWSSGYQTITKLCITLTPPLVIAMIFCLRNRERIKSREGNTLVGAFIWLLSSLYLWHTKAEVWFTHFVHLAYWSWTLLVLFEIQEILDKKKRIIAWIPALFPFIVGSVFLMEQSAQASRLSNGETWKWKTYDDWIHCIDQTLTAEFIKRGSPKSFQVWGPTFPDILIELSRKHPDWEFTRTNDFYERYDLGVKHGHEVDAMVVTETFRQGDSYYTGTLVGKPGSESVWMNWDQYFLKNLQNDPGFKKNRFLCQRARWDAFIYLNP